MQRLARETPFIETCLTLILYFCKNRIMLHKKSEQVVKFADMFSAIGTEARLRIMQLRFQRTQMDLSSAKFKKSWTYRIRRFPTISTS
jgi:hypothetical protein